MAAVMAARDIEVAAPEQLQEQPTLSDKSSEADGESQQLDVEAEAQLPPQRLILVVMVCMIQGYTLIGPLQHAFKVQMKIGDTGDVAHVFTQAAALVQWGKFAMTLGQNVLLACLCPMQRVFLAMVGMMLGCLIPPFFVYALGSTWLGWVFISFGLIGLSLGIFECTFLNVITPLGPLTKSYAIMGFPAAFAIINVLGMSIVSFGVPVHALFWYIVVCLPIGISLFATHFVPQLGGGGGNGHTSATAQVNKQAVVWNSLKSCSVWLPQLVPFMLANIVGHFVMEGALPANFNTFNDRQAPLLSRDDGPLMTTSQFFVVFFVFVGLGDMLSRRVGYCFRLDTYTSNLVALAAGIAMSVFGMLLTRIGVGVAAWASAFFAFSGQGFNYAVSAKYIDRFVPREHNLAAYSFWMFAGSAGAIAGSTMVDVLRDWICHGERYPHLCMAGHHR